MWGFAPKSTNGGRDILSGEWCDSNLKLVIFKQISNSSCEIALTDVSIG